MKNKKNRKTPRKNDDFKENHPPEGAEKPQKKKRNGPLKIDMPFEEALKIAFTPIKKLNEKK